MTNNEIVIEVYKTYKVKQMVKKLITNSSIDGSCDDLEQIIYIVLLKMDNKKLNMLYKYNELKKWINQIIKNQRNYYKNEYQTCRLKEHIMLDEEHEEDINNSIKEHDYKLDWLDSELNKYDWDRLNDEDEIIAAQYGMLKFYMDSGFSMDKIAKMYNMIDQKTGEIKHPSPTKINIMILEAKKNILENYERNFNSWFDNNSKFPMEPLDK